MGGIVNSALGSLPMINRAQELVSDYQSEQLRRQTEKREQELELRAAQEAEQQRLYEEQLAAAQEQHARNVLVQSQNLERIQLAQEQDTALKTKQADIDRRKAELAAAATVDEQGRRDTLARRLARTRASLGARGVGSGDGSAGALLAGLVSEADQEDRQSQADLTQKKQAFDQEVESTRQRNLLELSQLADRQKLELYSKSY